MSAITSELLNELMGLNDIDLIDNHSKKWQRLRRHFEYMTDEQFEDMYRAI